MRIKQGQTLEPSIYPVTEGICKAMPKIPTHDIEVSDDYC